MSGLALVNALHQARGINEGHHLVEERLDIQRNLNGLFDITGFGAGVGCFGDAVRLFKPLGHLREVHPDRGFDHFRIDGGFLLSPPHTLCFEGKSSGKSSNLMVPFRGSGSSSNRKQEAAGLMSN